MGLLRTPWSALLIFLISVNSVVPFRDRPSLFDRLKDRRRPSGKTELQQFTANQQPWINFSSSWPVNVVTVHDSGESEENHHHHHHLLHHHIKPIAVSRCTHPEVWYNCLPSCPITCDNLHKTCNPIDAQRCVQGCDCARGFVRNTPTGPCIPEAECPSRNPLNIFCVTILTVRFQNLTMTMTSARRMRFSRIVAAPARNAATITKETVSVQRCVTRAVSANQDTCEWERSVCTRKSVVVALAKKWFVGRTKSSKSVEEKTMNGAFNQRKTPKSVIPVASAKMAMCELVIIVSADQTVKDVETNLMRCSNSTGTVTRNSAMENRVVDLKKAAFVTRTSRGSMESAYQKINATVVQRVRTRIYPMKMEIVNHQLLAPITKYLKSHAKKITKDVGCVHNLVLIVRTMN